LFDIILSMRIPYFLLDKICRILQVW
jgi:hypothetical protein